MLRAALEQTGWPGGDVTAENWRPMLWQRLREADWPAAIRDVQPFLEREADLAWLTPDHCRRLLMR